MRLTCNINTPEIVQRVTNDEFGKQLAQEWKRLLDPYTPRDTGMLEETANILPFKIHYIQPYAVYVYYGEDLNFQKNNPYSTHHWDIAAESAGKKVQLAQIMNGHLSRNVF